MDLIVAALAAQQAELDGMLREATDADWTRPTRCPGWTVSDVVLHLAQTDELTLASAEGRLAEAAASWGGADAADTVDDRAEALVAQQRGDPAQQVLGRWRAGASGVCEAFNAVDPSARLTWVSGLVSARTLATTRLAETWIHTGDIAETFGVARLPGPQLEQIVRLAWRTLPYAFARAGKQLTGPVAVELAAPDGGMWVFVTPALLRQPFADRGRTSARSRHGASTPPTAA